MPSTERDEVEEIVGDGPQKTQQRKEEKASDDLPFAFRNEIGLEKLIEGYGERIGTELASSAHTDRVDGHRENIPHGCDCRHRCRGQHRHGNGNSAMFRWM